MSGRRMFRYEVPVDDQPHMLSLASDPVAVDGKITDAWPARFAVEFWAEHQDGDGSPDQEVRFFRVFGTGQPLPDYARWVGTCPRVAGLVWHLYEVTP